MPGRCITLSCVPFVAGERVGELCVLLNRQKHVTDDGLKTRSAAIVLERARCARGYCSVTANALNPFLTLRLGGGSCLLS